MQFVPGEREVGIPEEFLEFEAPQELSLETKDIKNPKAHEMNILEETDERIAIEAGKVEKTSERNVTCYAKRANGSVTFHFEELSEKIIDHSDLSKWGFSKEDYAKYKPELYKDQQPA